MKDGGGNIRDLDFIWRYVDSCASGALKLSECGPVWQLGVIAVLLGIAVIVLVALRVRTPLQTGAQ